MHDELDRCKGGEANRRAKDNCVEDAAEKRDTGTRPARFAESPTVQNLFELSLRLFITANIDSTTTTSRDTLIALSH
ncbi:hypothetical protein PMIN06_004624 [Paraphaeosphaeria minitans]